MTPHHRTDVDLEALRNYRISRVREQMRRHDLAGLLLYDPVNIRYAVDSSNMQVWTLHNAVRYLFLPAEGPGTLFDFHNCDHLSAGNPHIAEVRPAVSWYFFGAGAKSGERVRKWAGEIEDLLTRHGGGNRRLAVDRLDPAGYLALRDLNVEILDAQEVMETARSIKSGVEVAAMKEAIAAAELGMKRMQEAMRPGMTENELWAILHATNIEKGGEWIETRLLASGSRTNPWFQECSDRPMEKGDLVSFDTDLVGPLGYCADISRSWVCGTDKPSDAQRRLYELAMRQIEFNIDLLKPGMSFSEFSEKSFVLPDAYIANRYSVVAHGVGLCDEYPAVVYKQDFEHGGYDGLIEPGMTLCIESYVGEAGGSEGIKLEQQMLVTETGCVALSSYPWEDHWL